MPTKRNSGSRPTTGGSLMLRISGTLFINCVNVAVIIALVVLQDPSEEAMTWFYYVTLTIVVILNGSNGLYQNSVFGLTADFPAAYTNAIVVGNNICGTFISILSIATNLAFITDSKSVALTYFSITLAVLIVCILSLFYLTQVEFYKYYVNKGKQARIAEHATRPSLRQFCETFKGCWMQLLSVFLVFFVTLAVFPAVLAGTTPNRKGEPWNSDIPKDIYLGLTVFLNFNLLAAIGSTTANFVQIPGPNYILFPVLLRLLFIPYFMLCNYNVDDRVMPVLFENQWFFIIGNAIMAFTSGYFSSLAMMYAPRVVHSSLSKTAGMAAAAILVTGSPGQSAIENTMVTEINGNVPDVGIPSGPEPDPLSAIENVTSTSLLPLTESDEAAEQVQEGNMLLTTNVLRY